MMKAILTGHSRGLGAAIANELLGRQIPVLGLSRRAQAELAARYPKLLHQVEINLAQPDDVKAWLGRGELKSFLAGADPVLLINNAGTVQPIGPSETQDVADIAMAVNLNVTAPLMLSSAVAAARGSAELRIAHISSGAGRNAYAGWNIYCATKAALDHHARAASLDQSPHVKICSLAPGIIDTDMQAELRASSPERFPMQGDFVAMKRDGNLTKPADTAHKLVSYLLSHQFGELAVADLREVPV
jgi:hypothetical protein